MEIAAVDYLVAELATCSESNSVDKTVAYSVVE